MNDHRMTQDACHAMIVDRVNKSFGVGDQFMQFIAYAIACVHRDFAKRFGGVDFIVVGGVKRVVGDEKRHERCQRIARGDGVIDIVVGEIVREDRTFEICVRMRDLRTSEGDDFMAFHGAHIRLR